MIRRAVVTGVAFVTLALAPPASAQQRQTPAQLQQSIADLRAAEGRIQAIGWKLATANAPFCAAARPAIGLVLMDAGAWPQPDKVRTALKLSGPIAAQAVPPGSPAAMAELKPGAEIVSIAGQAIADLPAPRSPDWKRLAGLHDRIDAALASAGTVEIAWRTAQGQDKRASIAGVPACPSRFEVLSDSDRALADGTRVIIGRNFAGFGYAEEEFAAALAHELAHNILEHRLWLGTNGRNQNNIRMTEREADRMMPWLMANAGYPADAARRFMARWGPVHAGGIFRVRTHDGWDERAGFIAAELPRIAGSQARGGQANWLRDFARDTHPAADAPASAPVAGSAEGAGVSR